MRRAGLQLAESKPAEKMSAPHKAQPYVQLRRGSSFDQKAINETAQRPAQQRSDPINVMIVPEICRNSRAKHACGIHGRPGKRSPKQNVESDCRSNDEAGDAPRSAFIDGGAMNHKHEKES